MIRSRLAPLLLTLWLVAVSSRPATAQDGLAWRPDERVVLRAFHLVSALARDELRLYAASDGGLEVLDLLSGEWELPSTEEDGYPAAEEPSALAFDPDERVLWLGTLRGSLHTYHVDLQTWEAEGAGAPGPILRLVPWREALGSGVYARTPDRWYRIERFGGFPEPIPPGEVPPGLAALDGAAAERLAAEDPAFAAARGTVTVEDGRRWPVTDYVPGDRPGVYWLGTAGGNVVRWDGRFSESEALPFGPLTEGVSSLAVDGDGIWYGGDGRSPRRGVSRSDLELRRWTYHEAGPGPAPGSRVLDVHPAAGAVWFASADGLHRFDAAGDAWSRVPDLPSGVPVFRLAPGPDGAVWAATEHGVYRVSGEGAAAERVLAGRFRGVGAGGAGVWAAGETGVVRLDGAAPAADTGAPAGPFVDVAVGERDVWAATDGALWRFDGRTWSGPFREAALELGRIHRVRLTGETLWVAGEEGIGRRTGADAPWRYLLVGPAIPRGPAVDVVATDRWVWIATPTGAVRLDRRGDF